MATLLLSLGGVVVIVYDFPELFGNNQSVTFPEVSVVGSGL